MTDPIEALKKIRTLLDVASESNDMEIIREHLETVRGIIDKAVTPVKFPNQLRS